MHSIPTLLPKPPVTLRSGNSARAGCRLPRVHRLLSLVGPRNRSFRRSMEPPTLGRRWATLTLGQARYRHEQNLHAHPCV